MIEISNTITPLRPAATVILIRDGNAGLEVLLLQRNKAIRHMGGIWVFPGGKVEASDQEDISNILQISRKTAVRETSEETRIKLLPKELVPFSHWTTPEGVKKRFSTWFFVAHVDSHSEVLVDGVEITDYRWIEANIPISELNGESGSIRLAPPTFISLLELSKFSNSYSLIEALHTRDPMFFEPKMISIEDGLCFLYREDVAYNSLEIDVAGIRHRTYIRKNVLEYIHES